MTETLATVLKLAVAAILIAGLAGGAAWAMGWFNETTETMTGEADEIPGFEAPN